MIVVADTTPLLYLILIDGRQEAVRRHLNVLGTLRVLADAADEQLIDLHLAVGQLRQTNFRASEELFEWLLARGTQSGR